MYYFNCGHVGEGGPSPAHEKGRQGYLGWIPPEALTTHGDIIVAYPPS